MGTQLSPQTRGSVWPPGGLKDRRMPTPPRAALMGDIRARCSPPPERDPFVPGDESDAFITPAFRMGKLRLRVKVSA